MGFRGTLFSDNPKESILSVWELKHNMDEKFAIKFIDPIKYTVNKAHHYNVNRPWLINSERCVCALKKQPSATKQLSDRPRLMCRKPNAMDHPPFFNHQWVV